MQWETKVVRDGRTWIEIPNTAYGDYVGCTVERSNSEVLISRFKTEECYVNAWTLDEIYIGNGIYENPTFDPDTQIVKVTCDYSSSSLFALESNEEIQEIIAALADYPLIDEDHLSELELKLQYEYIEEEIIGEITRSYDAEIEKYCAEFNCTEDDAKDDMLELVNEYIEENNLSFIFEQAYCAYLRETDDVIEYVVKTLFEENTEKGSE